MKKLGIILGLLLSGCTTQESVLDPMQLEQAQKEQELVKQCVESNKKATYPECRQKLGIVMPAGNSTPDPEFQRIQAAIEQEEVDACVLRGASPTGDKKKYEQCRNELIPALRRQQAQIDLQNALAQQQLQQQIYAAQLRQNMPKPYIVPPLAIPKTTHCRTYSLGDQIHTDCN